MQIEYRHLGPADPLPLLRHRGSGPHPGLYEMPVSDPWLLPNLIRNVGHAVPGARADDVFVFVAFRGPSPDLRRATHVALAAFPCRQAVQIP